MNRKKIKTIEDIRKIKKQKKSQEAINGTKNKSVHDLKNLTLHNKNQFRRNFSFCDFKGTDLRGILFDGCNFCFSINLDKALTDKDTKFINCCNFSGADLPDEKLLTGKHNKKRFTDAEIEALDIEMEVEKEVEAEDR